MLSELSSRISISIIVPVSSLAQNFISINFLWSIPAPLAAIPTCANIHVSKRRHVSTHKRHLYPSYLVWQGLYMCEV